MHRFDEPVDTTNVAQLVTPSLVTIGHVEDRQILLDLDTAGSVALTGDRDAAEGVARSMLFELATQPLGHWADVIPVGFSTDGLEHLDGVWAPMSVERAIRHIRSSITNRCEYGATSIVAARTESDSDTGVWNSVVVVVNAATTATHATGELIGLCEPGPGFVTVVIGEHPAARERITVIDDHTATWQSATMTIGTTTAWTGLMTPPVVTLEAAAHVAVLLDHAAASEAVDAFDPPATGPDIEVDDDGTLTYREPSYDLLLRTFGAVTLESSIDSFNVELTPKQVELLTLLATHRTNPINAEVLVGFLSDHGQHKPGDPPMPPESISRRVSELRSRLGVDSDGEPFIPLAKQGRGAAGAYPVSARLQTDFELLADRVHAARTMQSSDALALLQDGLKYLTGPQILKWKVTITSTGRHPRFGCCDTAT